MIRLLKEMTILGLGALSLVYIANPTAGFFEFIPDALPLVGNLDEAGAVLILINTLRYYGIDPTDIWTPKQKQHTTENERENIS